MTQELNVNQRQGLKLLSEVGVENEMRLLDMPWSSFLEMVRE